MPDPIEPDPPVTNTFYLKKVFRHYFIMLHLRRVSLEIFFEAFLPYIL